MKSRAGRQCYIFIRVNERLLRLVGGARRYFIRVDERLRWVSEISLCFGGEKVLELVLHEVFVEFGSVFHVFERLPRVIVLAVTCPLNKYFESFSGELFVRFSLSLVLEDLFYEKLLLNVSLNGRGVRVFTFVIKRMEMCLVGSEDCVGGQILEQECRAVDLFHQIWSSVVHRQFVQQTVV